MAKNIYRVPLFITAPTDHQLVKAMAENNAKHDQEFEYFQINKEGSLWYAWFNASVATVIGTPTEVKSKKKGKK